VLDYLADLFGTSESTHCTGCRPRTALLM
jgi:hypothetical protein